MQRAYLLTVDRAVREWFAEHAGLVADAAEPSREVLNLVELAMKSIETAASRDAQQIERILGRKAAGNEQILRSFRSRNVALIKTVDEGVKAGLDRALQKYGNLHVEELTKRLHEVAGDRVTKARARLWARDQTLKLNADIVRAKHESLGIVEYIWRTSHDGTVRETHDALEGTRHRYDDPPETGTGKHNPGQDYQCRCHADPVLETAVDVSRTPEVKRKTEPVPLPRTQPAVPAVPVTPSRVAPLVSAVPTPVVPVELPRPFVSTSIPTPFVNVPLVAPFIATTIKATAPIAAPIEAVRATAATVYEYVYEPGIIRRQALVPRRGGSRRRGSHRWVVTWIVGGREYVSLREARDVKLKRKSRGK